MPFFLLLLLALACFPDRWPEPLSWLDISEGNPVLFSILTWLGVCLLVGNAWAASILAQIRLRRQPENRDRHIYRYARYRHYHFLCAYGFLVVAVYLFGWGWTVQTVFVLSPGGPTLPGAEIIVLAPFFTALVGSWFCFHGAERAINESAAFHTHTAPFISRGAYVRFHARQNLALVVAPLLLLILEKSLRRLFPFAQYETYFRAGSFVLLIFAFVSLPWILRLALGLTPLSAGMMRERLTDCAKRLRFRCSDILLWHTHGAVANAMVAGIVPWVRYVLLTDRLLADLTPDEVEAVFGHEIGHVKHRHMAYYMCFLLFSLTAVAGLWTLGMEYLFQSTGDAIANGSNVSLWLNEYPMLRAAIDRANTGADLEVVPLFMIAGAYIFVVFGFLSRRCERQADIYGCRAVSCLRSDCGGHEPDQTLAPRGTGLCPTGILTFIEALEKVARLNGINRIRPGWLQSWQHSTIARRVEFLQRLLKDPGLERRFQLRVECVKWGLLAVLAAVLYVLGTTQGWDKLGLF